MAPKKKSSKPELLVQVFTKVSPAEHTQLKDDAARAGRTMSAQLRFMYFNCGK